MLLEILGNVNIFTFPIDYSNISEAWV